MGIWNRYKTVIAFLIEWAAFLLLEAFRGTFHDSAALIAGLLTLLFFLLMGMAFSATARRWPRTPPLTGLVFTAMLLAGLDQVAKARINVNLAEGQILPLLGRWLGLGHERNYANSWLLHLLDINNVNKLWLVAFSLIMLVLIYFTYRYYALEKRGGFWPAAAFALITAGVTSAIFDQAVWRFTLDFISLTGLVTADLKDIYLMLGIGCVLAEMFSNPATRWRFTPREDLRDFLNIFRRHNPSPRN